MGCSTSYLLRSKSRQEDQILVSKNLFVKLKAQFETECKDLEGLAKLVIGNWRSSGEKGDGSHPFDRFPRPLAISLTRESTPRNLPPRICIHKLLSSSFHFLPFMTV